MIIKKDGSCEYRGKVYMNFHEALTALWPTEDV